MARRINDLMKLVKLFLVMIGVVIAAVIVEVVCLIVHFLK